MDLSLKEPELVLLSPLSLGGERHSEKQRKGERDTQRHRLTPKEMPSGWQKQGAEGERRGPSWPRSGPAPQCAERGREP